MEDSGMLEHREYKSYKFSPVSDEQDTGPTAAPAGPARGEVTIISASTCTWNLQTLEV